jgi:RNA polymerase sigma-70 factor (ECF subfamily)
MTTKTETEQLIEKYWDMVYRIAFNYYRNKSDAEDTTQDVMFKYYRNAQDGKCFESDEHARHWLIRVTINQCKSVLRGFWRKNRISQDEFTEMTQSDVWDNAEQRELYAAVMALPEQHRTVLYLHYYEELTTKELAEMLGQSEAHIRTRLSRARNKLKEVWTNDEE